VLLGQRLEERPPRGALKLSSVFTHGFVLPMAAVP
jgi:hypothetical protein